MCAYVTNHHLWSYLLFMYGAMSTLQWWRASFKESRLLGVSMKGKGKESIVNCSLILMRVILLALSVLVLG